MTDSDGARSPRDTIRGRIAEEEEQEASGEVTSERVARVGDVTRAADLADSGAKLSGEIGPLAGLLTLRPALGLFAHDAIEQHVHTHGPAAFAEHRRLHPRLHAFSYGVDAFFRVTGTVLIVSGGGAIVWKIVFGRL